MLKVNDLEMVFSAGSVQLDFPEVRGNLQVVRDLWGLGVTCLPSYIYGFLSPIGLDIMQCSALKIGRSVCVHPSHYFIIIC